jgi:glycosyltransferase involved in cell wall biosynthesis
VSDYTRLLARGLARAGDEVHVWAPAATGSPADLGVTVHRLPGRFGPRGLVRLDAALRRTGRPFRLLVQYVPHAYGCRAMNIPFCAWLLARRAWRPWVMFHEVAFPWGRGGPPRHTLLAAVHRGMAALVLRAADRVFVSTPAWGPLLRRLARRAPPPTWLPIPSTVGLDPSPAEVAAVRHGLAAPPEALVVGHFGTYGREVVDSVAAVLPALLAADGRRHGLLLGRGSRQFAARLVAAHPHLAGRVHATGETTADAAAAHLRACDLLLEPYPDGATGRRTTLMAGLALGVPVVTTRGALTEPLWDEQGLAELVPAADTDALTAAAERLAAHPEDRRALGERGRAGYERFFSLDHTVRALRDAAASGGRTVPIQTPGEAVRFSRDPRGGASATRSPVGRG